MGYLGYAVTAHRAQGTTTDTAHILVDASTTRENLYVAMTRGREANHVYVATDKPDDSHDGPHPSDNPDATARGVLYGVQQHVGAELTAHETITTEQEVWGSVAQLAAEYETIAQAAQHDRWATLIRACGITHEDAEDTIRSETFGALTAELRRAEAEHHNVEVLLPRLAEARGFGDADDIAAVLHHRLARVTVRPASSGRVRKAPRLLAGLIPEATGSMTTEMRRALAERRDLIFQRTNAVLDQALAEGQEWTRSLGEVPDDAKAVAAWRPQAQVVAAYRDRYGISTPTPLGPAPDSAAQKIDAARAETALARLHELTLAEPGENRSRPTQRDIAGRTL